MYNIEFEPKADAEYQHAYAWYEQRLPGLVERFERCLDRKISSISTTPLLYPAKKYDIRECKINDSPYLIIL